jgi:hypothetical protein
MVPPPRAVVPRLSCCGSSIVGPAYPDAMLPPMVATRALVGAAVAVTLSLALSACTSGSPAPTDSAGWPLASSGSTLAAADAQAVERSWSAETGLLGRLNADVERYGRRVAGLRPVVTAVSVHANALAEANGTPEAGLASAEPPASSPAAAVHRAVLGLAAAARVSARPVPDPATGVTGAVAALLGSVSASDSALATTLSARSPRSAAAGASPTSGGAIALSALQAALAGEYAAIYAYGVVGGQLAAHAADPSLLAQAHAGLNLHSTRRDQLVAMIRAAGGAADPGAGGYVVPFPVASIASARRLASTVESRCAGNYAQLVSALAPPGARGAPLTWLGDAARRQALWSGVAPALPGLQPATGSP